MQTETQVVASYLAQSGGDFDAAIGLAQYAFDLKGTDALLKHRADQREAADPSLKARRLRLEAQGKRARYQTEMTEYGHAVGSVTKLHNAGRASDALRYEQAAQRALAYANRLLTEALALEEEAAKVEGIV